MNILSDDVDIDIKIDHKKTDLFPVDISELPESLLALSHQLLEAPLGRLGGFLLQPDLEALVHDVPGHATEEEVDRAERGKVHRLELFAPAAVLRQLQIVLRVGRQ